MDTLLPTANQDDDSVHERFQTQIEKLGLEIDSIDEDGLIHIKKGNDYFEINLENSRRIYEKEKGESNNNDFANVIFSETDSLPDWESIKNDIYIHIFPSNYDFQEIINKKITNEFNIVYIINQHERLTWILRNDIVKLKINENLLDGQAKINSNKLLENTTLKTVLYDDKKLGFFVSDNNNMLGAILFSPNLKEKVINDFGWPIYAVIPVRDFCCIFSENDFDYFSEGLKPLVIEEYNESGYPITTELLKISDEGVVSVRKY